VADIRIVDRPAESWTRAVEKSPDGRLAHARAWHTAIAAAYGHSPLYLAATDGDATVGVLPSFVVRRPCERL